uniref:Uncharacterized protein n=1 Tax=Pyramimonas orientalis virus TaxID=455367 RepID=A0A7M3UNP9_POV01|nr:hypothetical protein HWQ62_00187 [Pyramimonas orientalis virus]
MNRKLFFAYQPLIVKKHSAKIVPVRTRKVDDTYTFFVSSNNKLVIKTTYKDFGSFVTVSNEIIWDDPVSNETIKKNIREMYILDIDSM